MPIPFKQAGNSAQVFDGSNMLSIVFVDSAIGYRPVLEL